MILHLLFLLGLSLNLWNYVLQREVREFVTTFYSNPVTNCRELHKPVRTTKHHGRSTTLNAELRILWQNCQHTLDSLVSRLEERPDMQKAIRQMMTTDEMLEAFSQTGVKDPDLASIPLRSSPAALVNTQSVKAIEPEQSRRWKLNRCEV